jgi:hypothetical protein
MGEQQGEDERMQRGRFTFDNYLGMVLFALLWESLAYAFLILLGPQIHSCFCPADVPSCCTPALFLPPWPQVYLLASLAVLTLSLVVVLVGIILGRTRRTTVDANVVYALMLCPFLTLVFLGVVASIVSLLALTVWPA